MYHSATRPNNPAINETQTFLVKHQTQQCETKQNKNKQSVLNPRHNNCSIKQMKKQKTKNKQALYFKPQTQQVVLKQKRKIKLSLCGSYTFVEQNLVFGGGWWWNGEWMCAVTWSYELLVFQDTAYFHKLFWDTSILIAILVFWAGVTAITRSTEYQVQLHSSTHTCSETHICGSSVMGDKCSKVSPLHQIPNLCFWQNKVTI